MSEQNQQQETSAQASSSQAQRLRTKKPRFTDIPCCICGKIFEFDTYSDAIDGDCCPRE